MNGMQKLEARMITANSLLCVGLDTDIRKLPLTAQNKDQPQLAFNQSIIEKTHPYAAAYKLNTAFYEARGTRGWEEMKATVAYLHHNHPDIFVIADAKRGDIGSTNEAYVQAIYDELGFDAVTLHPYVGREALQPFLSRSDRAAIILCRTSSPDAGELQDLEIDGRPLWMIVAEHVANEWNTANNCMLVVGATYPLEMQRIREVARDMTFLVPGIGAQGGDLAAVMNSGLNDSGRGLLINSSRGILLADDPAVAAREVHTMINKYRG